MKTKTTIGTFVDLSAGTKTCSVGEILCAPIASLWSRGLKGTKMACLTFPCLHRDFTQLHNEIDYIADFLKMKQNDRQSNGMVLSYLFLCTCWFVINEAERLGLGATLVLNAREDIGHAFAVKYRTTRVTPELLEAIEEAREEVRFVLTQLDIELADHYQRVTVEWTRSAALNPNARPSGFINGSTRKPSKNYTASRPYLHRSVDASKARPKSA